MVMQCSILPPRKENKRILDPGGQRFYLQVIIYTHTHTHTLLEKSSKRIEWSRFHPYQYALGVPNPGTGLMLAHAFIPRLNTITNIIPPILV